MPRTTLQSINTFGDLLRHLRRRAQLTQRELGIAVGYSEAHMARLESGQRLPDLVTVRTLLVAELGLDKEPELAARLVALAEAARAAPSHETPPSIEEDVEPPPGNLPVQLTRFIGRQREIADVKNLLSATRLLTLTGTGGAGKTRLALQVAAESLQAYPDGVWLVELATVFDPAGVTETMITTLGLAPSQRQALETLADYLRDRKRLLLILDNCEHLITACAGVAAALLRMCQHLSILATSREGLNVPGETIWRVPPLETNEAGQIFVEYARAARPGFVLNEQNAPVIAQICARLDGMPLAIELAAARLKVMSVYDIAARLDDRFTLLADGARTALPRHQTLRTLIDWSYDLLSEQERLLLQRLSIFVGGWTLVAAEAVCTDDRIRAADILHLLFDLVSKSLVNVDERADETRYLLLDTVREYATVKLQENGAYDDMRRRHAAAYCTLAEQAEAQFYTRTQKLWIDRLNREHDNIQAALAWSRSKCGDLTVGLRLAGSLWQFWLWHGYIRTGLRSLQDLLQAMPPDAPAALRAPILLGASALALPESEFVVQNAVNLTAQLEQATALFSSLGDDKGTVMALSYLAQLAEKQHDYARAKTVMDRNLAIARQMQRPTVVPLALIDLGHYAEWQQNWTRAIALFEECLALERKAENGRGIATALISLGLVALRQRDFTRAREMSQQGLQMARQAGYKLIVMQALMQIGEAARYLGDFRRARAAFEELQLASVAADEPHGIGFGLQLLAKVACDEGDFERARDLYLQSLEYRHRLGAWSVPYNLEGLASVASGQGQAVRAAQLYGAAEAIRAVIDTPLQTDNIPEYERQVAAVRAQLDTEACAAAWAEGRAMSVDEAVAYAQAR